MIPKIKFFWSFGLQTYILRSNYNPKKLDEYRKKLEKIFRIHEKIILNKIPEYTGFEWKRKEIPVWIIDGFHDSIPDPLLLNNYNWDKSFTLFELVHMLVHIILLDNDFYKKFIKNNKFNEDALEIFTYFITKNVIKNIFDKKTLTSICNKAEMNMFKTYIWRKINEIENLWDVEKISLKNITLNILK